MANWLKFEKIVAIYLADKRWTVMQGMDNGEEAEQLAVKEKPVVLVEIPQGSFLQKDNRGTHSFFESKVYVSLFFAPPPQEINATQEGHLIIRRNHPLIDQIQEKLMKGILTTFTMSDGVVSNLQLSQVERKWDTNYRGESGIQKARFTINFRTVEAAPSNRGIQARTFPVRFSKEGIV